MYATTVYYVQYVNDKITRGFCSDAFEQFEFAYGAQAIDFGHVSNDRQRMDREAHWLLLNARQVLGVSIQTKPFKDMHIRRVIYSPGHAIRQTNIIFTKL